MDRLRAARSARDFCQTLRGKPYAIWRHADGTYATHPVGENPNAGQTTIHHGQVMNLTTWHHVE